MLKHDMKYPLNSTIAFTLHIMEPS